MKNIFLVKTNGGSMRPTLKNSQFVWIEELSPENLKIGDMVLYEQDGLKYLHRIRSKNANSFVIGDDAAISDKHTILYHQVLGKPLSLLNGPLGHLWGITFYTLYRFGRALKNTLSTLALFLFVLSVFNVTVYSATRIKTIEWNYGGYYSATDIKDWTPSYLSINIPDAIATSPIKNAYLEIEFLSSAGAAADTTNIDVYFNTGTSPSAVVDNITGTQIPDSSGESNRMCIRADVTSQFTAWADQPYSMRTVITGPNCNMFTAKLYITYYYDDTATTQIKTVRFPLFSSSGDSGISGVASYLAQRPAGTSSFSYYVDVPETGITRKQLWFEVKGYRQAGGASTDGSLYCQIGSNAAEPTMTLDGALRDTYRFRYLSQQSEPIGFDVNTGQTLNVVTAGNANMNVLGGEVALTYEFPGTAATKEKTAVFFLGQSPGNANGDVTIPVFLNETNVTIKRIYAIIHGSYDSTTALSLTINSKIGGNSLSSRAYSLVTQAAQVSGFDLFHDMTEGVTGGNNYWVNGSTVNITWTDTTALGALGIELVVTYTYTDENYFTDYYKVFAGQTANEVASGAAFNYAFNLFFPDPETPLGNKTLRDAYLEATYIEGDGSVTDDPTTTMNVNSASGKAQTVDHRSAGENFQTTALYAFSNRITPSSTTATANYMLTNDPYNMAACANILYEYAPVPNSPQSLVQYRSNGTTIVESGSWINEQNLKLSFTATAKRAGDVIYPVIELKNTATSFNGVGLSTGTAYVVGTSSITTVSTSTVTGQYQWRASLYANGLRSPWVNFGIVGTRHFGVDVSTPSAPAPSSPANNSYSKNRSQTFAWGAVTDAGSGTKDYTFELSNIANFSSIYYSSQTAATSVLPPLLSQNTYYWRVRAYDVAANTSTWSSTWKIIIDTTGPSAVTLNAPLHNTTTSYQTIQFNWNPATDALSGTKEYILQLSTSASFNPVRYSSTTAQTSATLSNIIQSSYTWRVNVRDTVLNYTTSTVRYTIVVDTSPPGQVTVLSAPLNNMTTNQMTMNFSWGSVTGAAKYYLQLSKYADFSTIAYSSRTALTSAALTVVQSSYTWRVNTEDGVLNYSSSTKRYTVIVDTTPSRIQINTIPDTSFSPPHFRGSGNIFDGDVDLYEGGAAGEGMVKDIKYWVTSEANGGGTLIIDTSTIQMDMSVKSYSTAGEWVIPFSGLKEWATNYVHLLYTDTAGNNGIRMNVFDLLKDTTPPVAPGFVSPENNYKTNSQSIPFDWATVTDLRSGTSFYTLHIATSTNYNPIYRSSITALSQSSISSIAQNQYYWRLAATDRAANTSSYSSNRSFLVDITPSSHTIGAALLGGDTTERDVNDGSYDVDFHDIGGSNLDRFEISVSTSRNRGAPLRIDWTDSLVNINAQQSYTTNWQLPFAVWQTLQSGTTNYISIKTYDLVGNTSAYIDAFFVKRVAGSVRIDNYEAEGEDSVWRSTSTARAFNVDFNFLEAGGTSATRRAQYKAHPSQDYAGTTPFFNWKDIPELTFSATYYNTNWYIGSDDFVSLQDANTNYISVRIWDANTSTATAYNVFVVKKDTSPPAVATLVKPLNAAATGQLTTNFSWHKTTDLASGTTLYHIQVATSTNFNPVVYQLYPASTSIKSSLLNQSTYFWKVRSKDITNNWSDFTSPWSVQVDTTPPGIVALASPLTVFATNYITQTLAWSTLVDSGPAGTGLYQLNISTKNNLLPLYYSNTTTGLSLQATLSQSATYYWNVKAIDRAGNYGTVKTTWAVVMDTIAPQIPLLTTPLHNFATNHVSLTFNWSSADTGPAARGILNYTVEISTDTDFVPLYASSTTALTSFTTSFAHNAYHWRAKARDKVGNVSNYSAYRAFIVDLTPPTVPALLTPADDTRTKLLQRQFTWSAATDSGAGQTGVNGYQLLVSTKDNFSVINFSSSTGNTFASITFSQDNIYYWKVRSSDTVNNYSAYAATRSMTIDTAAPFIADHQAGDANWRTAAGTTYNVDFFTSNDAYTSGLSSAGYRVYASTTAIGEPAGTQLVPLQQIFTYSLPARTTYYVTNWPLSSDAFSSMQQGYNFVFVQALDLAGNLIEPSTYSFFIKKDTAAPSFVNYETAPVWENTDRTRNVDFSDYGSGVTLASYTAYGLPNQGGAPKIAWTQIFNGAPVSLYDTNWSLDFPLLKPGTNYISLAAYDDLGNERSTSDIFKVFKDTIAPSAINNLASTQGSSAGYINVTWTTPADDSLTDAGNTRLKNYLVKYKTSNFSNRADFLATGTTFYQAWTPKTPGLSENQNVTGLMEGTTYYIGIISIDKASNYSLVAATASTWAKRVAPSPITDLVASDPGTLAPGQVQLVWTAVGDDAKTGTASGYVLKYATFAFTAAEWDTHANVATYVQSWGAADPGTIETQVVGGFAPGSLFYFAIKTYDNASPGANYSVRSNTSSVIAAQTGAADGILVYGQTGVNYPKYYTTTSAGSVWLGPYNSSDTASASYWVVARAAPMFRNEKLVASLGSGGQLYLQRWDGQNSQWNNTSGWPVQLTPSTLSTAYRCFDIAYEQNTGRAIIVYGNAADTGNVYYRVWSSTAAAWVVGETVLDMNGATTTGFSRWVRLEPRPGTNEIMLLTVDDNRDLYAYRWTGSAWQNNQLMDDTVYTANYQCFDVAWEKTSGDCIVLWGISRAMRYSEWDSQTSAWTTVDALGPDFAMGNNGANWVKLSSDRKTLSDKVAASAIDTAEDWNVVIWDGSAWGTATELSATLDGTGTSRLMDIAWEKDTGECLAVGVLLATPAQYITYSQYASGVWGSPQTYTAYSMGNATDIRWLQLAQDPNSNKLVLFASNDDAASEDLRTLNWTGSGFSGGESLTTAGSTNLYEFFGLALDRHDIEPPSIANAQMGDDTWRKTDAATYAVAFHDTGGSGLTKFQLQLDDTAAGASPYRTWTDEITGINADDYTSSWPFLSATWNALLPGKTYVSIKVFDAAGNSDTDTDVFYVLKDTQAPTLTNNALGKFTTWYNSDPGNIVDINFSDQAGLSLLTTAQYLAYPDATMAGAQITNGMIFDYTSNPQLSHVTDFGLNWSLLTSGTNYISVKTYDKASNILISTDSFKILKDTTPPAQVVSLAAPANNSYKNQNPVAFSWGASSDMHSRIKNYVLQLSTSASFNPIAYSSATHTTNATLNVNSSSYTWRVNVIDYALNYTTSSLRYTVIVDTIPLAGITPSSPANNTITKQTAVSFQWGANAQAQRYVLQLSTSASFNPVRYSSTTQLSSALMAINQSSYTWRVNVIDYASNYTTSTIRWSIVVDSTLPNISIVNTADTAQTPPYFRKSGNITANVNFTEGGIYGPSLLNQIKYKVSSKADDTGTTIIDWANVAAPPISQATYTNDWTITFAPLKEWATNYVHIYYSDLAGNNATYYAAFDILKDTTNPPAAALVSPAQDTKTNNPSILFDWANSTDLRSGTSYYMLQLSTSASDFNPIAYSSRTSISQARITTIAQKAYYWRVYSVDRADNYSTGWSTRAFLVDLSTPIHVNNVPGDTANRAVNDGVYDFRFKDDGGSKLDMFEISASTKTGLALPLIGWTDSGVLISGATFYDTPWNLVNAVWEALEVGNTNYISIRTYDLAGNASTYIDAFYVKRIASNINITDNEGEGEDILWRSTSTIRAFNIDVSADSNLEAIEYKAHPNQDYSGTSPLFDWKSIPNITLAGTSFTDPWYIGDADFQDLTDGNTNYISVRAWAVGTATATVYNAFVVKKDTTPPAIPTLLKPLNAAATGYLTVNFAWQGSSDLASGTTLYHIIVATSTNFNPVVYALYPTSRSILSTMLPQSTYYWKVRAKDRAQNWSSYSAPWSVQVDTTTPNQPALSAPLNGLTTNYTTPLFSWAQASDRGPAGIAGYYIRISTKASFIPLYYSAVTSGVAASTTLSPSATYYWNVKAIDRAGNYSTATTTFSVVVDIANPNIPTLGQPLNTYTTNQITVALTWSGSDTGPAATGIKNYDVQASTSTDFNPLYRSSTTALLSFTTQYAQNRYYWRVRARDNVNNVSDYASYRNFIVDQSSPLATTLLAPANDTRTKLLQRTFSWNTATEVGYAGVYGYHLAISTDPVFSVIHHSSITQATQATITFGEQNIYYWKVRSYDRVNNYSLYSATNTITIDTTAPTIGDNAGDDTWRTVSATYNIDFFDTPSLFGAGLSTASYRVYSATTPAGAIAGSQLVTYTAHPLIFNKTLPERTTYYTADWSISNSWNSLKEGYNFVFVKSFDFSGNSYEPSSYAFHVKKDTTPPVSINYETAPVWENTGRARNVDVYDYASGVVTSSYSVYPQPNRQGSPVVSWTKIFTVPPVNLYDTDWSLAFDLLHPGTNYISLRSADYLSQTRISTDVFKVWKDTIAPDNIANISSSLGANAGQINVAWTAPADDPVTDTGNTRLKSYVAKYKTTNFTDRTNYLLTGTTFYQSWLPAIPGNAENRTITGLTEGTTYFIGILPKDKAGNYSMQVATTSYYAKRVPPGKITNLAGSTPAELSPGQIQLTWTAVGDNSYSGTASGYVVKYATFPFTVTQWSTHPNVNTYSQGWTPAPAGTGETQILSGFSSGVLMYFAIQAYDSANNFSVISTTTSATVQAAGAGDGMLVYGKGSNTTPFYRTFISAGTSWNAENPANAAAATIYWSRLAACPVLRNEKQLATLSSTGELYMQRWDGTVPSWGTPVSMITMASGDSAYRPFDIAYEQSSGRAMVAYQSTNGGRVYYRVWSSTAATWAQNQTEIVLGGTGLIRWVRLESRPGTNQIAIVTLDANNDIYANIWNGSSWGTATLMTANANVSTTQCFDVAWETTRGYCHVLWGETATYYRTWNGSSWSGTAIAGPSIGGTAHWIKMAADPSTNSNSIAMAALDTVSDWNVSVWNATTWATPTELSASMNNYTTRMIDLKWEKTSGRCVAVGVISGANNRFVTSAVYASGSWGAASTYAGYALGAGSSVALKWLQLVPDPNSNRMVLLGSNSDANGSVVLRSLNWTGLAWSGGAELSTSGSTNSYEFYALDYDRHEIIPPTMLDTQSGDDTWRSRYNTAYTVEFHDTGNSLLNRVQTRLATGLAGTGEYRTWANELSNINTNDITAPWQLSAITWNQLRPGKSYISLKVIDGAGNSHTENDSFYVYKDTQPPAVTKNNMPALNTWLTADPGTVLDIDIADQATLSKLTSSYYLIYPNANLSGTKIAEAAIFQYTPDRASYSADFALQAGHWDLLQNTTNYVSVKAYDVAGNIRTSSDTFKIFKDTVPPAAITTLAVQPGPYRGSIDLSWRAPGDNGFIYQNIGGAYIIKFATYQITEVLFNGASTYAQTMLPGPPKTLETITLLDLSPATTYYFAVKTRDKISPARWSAISNSTATLPQIENIYINELFVAGSATQDWVELFNNTQSNIPLAGWTIAYNPGSITAPGIDEVVWTGTTETALQGEPIVINLTGPGVNLDGESNHHIKLIDNNGIRADRVQWPAGTAATQSIARITDGNHDFFEIDPTPTKGYANALSTGVIKINEVDYASAQEFIELFNDSNADTTMTNWYLRNSNNIPFRFTRTIGQYSFTGLDFSSVDTTAKSWADAFGINGLKAAADFVTLENTSGQIIDRVSWQSGTTYSYYDFRAVPVTFNTPFLVDTWSSPNTIGRQPLEGKDTDASSVDLAFFALPTYGMRNTNASPGEPNILNYPSNTTFLPRRFNIDLQLGQNSSGGYNDTLWFIRTGGSADTQSPHIYNLPSIGINAATVTRQTTTHIGLTFNDRDGSPLVANAIYTIVLNSDYASGASTQVVRTNITYDNSIHSVAAVSAAHPYANNDMKYGLLRFDITNTMAAGRNTIELSTVTVRFTNTQGAALTTTQAKNLFKNLSIVADNPVKGTQGTYQSAIDTETVSLVSNNAISLDAAGRQVFAAADPDAAVSRISPAGTGRYFLAAEFTADADQQIPNTFKAYVVPGSTDTIFRDGPSDVAQPGVADSQVMTSTPTIIEPKQPPIATSFPAPVTSPGNEFFANVALNQTATTVFAGTKNGKIRALTQNGDNKWTVDYDAGSPINTLYDPTWQMYESGPYLYFGTQSGYLYKIQDNGDNASNVWTPVNLGAAVTSELSQEGDPASYLYIGTGNGRLYKYTESGDPASGWQNNPGITGAVVGAPVIDTFSNNNTVNAVWLGSNDGTIYKISNLNGTIMNSADTSFPIQTSLLKTSGFVNEPAKNTHNVYFGDTQGNFRCRTSDTLSTAPGNWSDINTGGVSVYGSPNFDGARGVYFGTTDGTLYKVDVSSGGVYWTFKAQGAIRDIPLLGDNNDIFFGADDGYFYGLNITNGALLSGFPVATGGEIRSAPVYDGTRIYFNSNDGKVYCIEP